MERLDELLQVPCSPEVKSRQAEFSEWFHDRIDYHLGNKGFLTKGVVNKLQSALDLYIEQVEVDGGNDIDGLSERYIFLTDTLGTILECYYNQEKDPWEYSYPRLDGESKIDILCKASQYITEPQLHCKAVTNLISKAVLDTEIFPLSIKMGSEDKHLEKMLENPSIILRSNFTILVVGIGAAITYNAANYYNIPWAGGSALVLFLLYLGYAVSYRYIWTTDWNKRQKIYGKLNGVLCDLKHITDEIGINSYNAERLSERLRKIEDDGGHFPSIVYSLLKLNKTMGPE